MLRQRLIERRLAEGNCEEMISLIEKTPKFGEPRDLVCAARATSRRYFRLPRDTVFCVQGFRGWHQMGEIRSDDWHRHSKHKWWRPVFTPHVHLNHNFHSSLRFEPFRYCNILPRMFILGIWETMIHSSGVIRHHTITLHPTVRCMLQLKK